MDYNSRSSLALKEENCVGQIQKIFGKDGELVVKVWDNFPDDIIEEPLWIEIDSKGVPLFLKSIKPQGLSKVVAVFEDWQSEELATELVGKKIYFESQDDVEKTESVIGWTLKDTNSCLSGTITDISDSETNPLLFVEIDGLECLVPFTEDFITDFDEEAKVLYMELPEGLLNL